jgi:acetylglutamate kinase
MKPVVVKIGGSTLGSHDTTLEDIVSLKMRGLLPVVVHGGGQAISEWLSQRGCATSFVQGQRCTNTQSLEVVVAVLAGLVNKQLVAAINSLGGCAFGISGVDGHFIEARIKSPELGYVGEVVKVNTEPLEVVLHAGFIPVIAPLGYQPLLAPDKDGKLLNINADAVAGDIAAALGAERLIFLTDVAGVCDDRGEVLPKLSPTEAESLINLGVISGGMIPKVEACLCALPTVPSIQIIDGRLPSVLIKTIEGQAVGTRIGL